MICERMNGSGSAPITMAFGWLHGVQQTRLDSGVFRGMTVTPLLRPWSLYARCLLDCASAGEARSIPRPRVETASPSERNVIFVLANGMFFSIRFPMPANMAPFATTRQSAIHHKSVPAAEQPALVADHQARQFVLIISPMRSRGKGGAAADPCSRPKRSPGSSMPRRLEPGPSSVTARASLRLRSPSPFAGLIGELELRGAVRVAPAAGVVELLSETNSGLPEQGFDLRPERLDVWTCIRRGRGADVALLGDGRVREMQLGGLDVPFAALVSGAGNLAVFDRFQNCRLVQAGRGCSRCKGVRHTHTTVTLLTMRATLRRNCC